jgi:L-ascorbate metabolism protein UlaG (beta-lactamase superfamily)
MTLRWFGQSCFLLIPSAGAKVLMDPFRKFFRYALPPLEADIVTSSHAHPDHDFTEAGGPGALVITGVEGADANGVAIRGVAAWHDAKQGASRGPNVIFTVEAEGLRVCHCGDLGHDLDEARLEAIGRVDILLVPCGGMASAGAALAARLVEQLKPAIVVPMHYRTAGLGLARFIFAPVDGFLKACGLPVRREVLLRVDAASLAAATKREIVILDWEADRHD